MPKSPRFRLAALAALLIAPLVLANSMSTYNVQRRLENYTNQIIDSCRKNNNDTGRSSPTPYAWTNPNIKSPAEVRREAAENSAYWDRRREQEAELARQSREAAAERAAAAQARIEQFVREEMARRTQADWNSYRQRVGNYAARTPVPAQPTPARFLAWLLQHNAQAPNQWAQIQAAYLLIDGLGVPADLAAAERLLSPASTPPGEEIFSEKRALLAYVQALRAAPASPAITAAREQLRSLTDSTPTARWCLARLLSTSSASTDRLDALLLFPEGHYTVRLRLGNEISGDDRTCHDFISATFQQLITRCAAELPAAISAWSPEALKIMARNFASSDLTDFPHLLERFADAVARRCVNISPASDFDSSSFNPVLTAAARSGSPSAHALAVLERFHLIHIAPPNPDKMNWRGHDNSPRAIDALERWAAGTDPLAARSRLALQLLAEEIEAGERNWQPALLPEVLRWHETSAEALRLKDEDWSLERTTPSKKTTEAIAAADTARAAAIDAFARRDAQSPGPETIAPSVRILRADALLFLQFAQLRAFESSASSDSLPGFQIDSPAFDLARAAALFDEACADDTPVVIRKTLLFEATRLGDAFAPQALARLLPLGPAHPQLLTLARARQSRDEKPGQPRVIAARLLLDLIARRDPEAALHRAAAAGSPLATRILLDRKIGDSISRTPDRPPSWQLSPALIAEFDAAVPATNADRRSLSELNLLHAVASPAERVTSEGWFNYIWIWDQDLQRRAADAALLAEIRPAITGIVEILAQRPGFNRLDPLHASLLETANTHLDAADKLIFTDTPRALAHLTLAAANGERDSLSRLAELLRQGTGPLPSAPDLAALIDPVVLQLLQADADAGDPEAAYAFAQKQLPDSDPQAARRWLTYAALRGNRSAAHQLCETPDNPASASHRFHAIALLEAVEKGEYLPVPPRRPSNTTVSLAPIKPRLLALVTETHRRLQASDPSILALAQAEPADPSLHLQAMRDDPLNTLLALAEKPDSIETYFALALHLGNGDWNLTADPELARACHTLGLSLLNLRAELGDATTAHRLGLYQLGLGQPENLRAGLDWLAYAANLGLSNSAQLLAELYSSGLPGLAADAATARRWRATEFASADFLQPKSPARRLTGTRTPAADFSTQATSSLAAARRAAQARTLEGADTFAARFEAALFHEEKAVGLRQLLNLAASGHSGAAFTAASIFSSGETWLQPDPELAQQLQQAAFLLLEAEAERGDAPAALRLGRYKLLASNSAAELEPALRWLTYAAELGHAEAAAELAELYRTGAPGLPADPAQSERWTLFGETVTSENFKPRTPLR